MQSEDFAWFVDNYEELFLEYGVSYLAIKNKAVIGVYSTLIDGIKETVKTEPLGTFIVQKCDGTSDAYTAKIASTYFM